MVLETPKILESQNLPIMQCDITDKVLKAVFAPSTSSFVETTYLFQLWYWPLNLSIHEEKTSWPHVHGFLRRLVYSEKKTVVFWETKLPYETTREGEECTVQSCVDLILNSEI